MRVLSDALVAYANFERKYCAISQTRTGDCEDRKRVQLLRIVRRASDDMHNTMCSSRKQRDVAPSRDTVALWANAAVLMGMADPVYARDVAPRLRAAKKTIVTFDHLPGVYLSAEDEALVERARREVHDIWTRLARKNGRKVRGQSKPVTTISSLHIHLEGVVEMYNVAHAALQAREGARKASS